MDFSWTDEQLDLRKRVIQFAEDRLNDDVIENDQRGVFDRARWNECAAFGIPGMNIPVEYGGEGQDALTSVLAMEALGYGCKDLSLPFGLNCQMWTTQRAITHFGSEAQKRKYLPGLCDGSAIGVFSITEAEAGSDSYALQTTAVKKGDGYVLNGQKAYVTSGPVSDLAVVFVSTNLEHGKWGISAFIVETGTDGFTIGLAREKMGLRRTPMSDLIFEDCFVPESARLGPEGIGVSMFSKVLESERSFIFASHVGRMERQLHESITFAKERVAFGQPIGKFQSVSNRLADMKMRLETSRMLLYRAAWMDDKGQSLISDAALTKLHISESFVESSMDAIRINGARGFVSEFGIERDLRDGVGGVIYSGTSDIQRNIIARTLEVGA